jgi:hypothetical protein
MHDLARDRTGRPAASGRLLTALRGAEVPPAFDL